MPKHVARPRRGRPPHTDDPPVMVGTTVPTSINRLLMDLSRRLGRPRSEILADAIRAYARRYQE
ncbi:MAG TPA: ribbon-helix-helix domain-containing protein [Vicinamibacterales bacterium]|nr:ribbon-helix-helix domain-containing protein [Vicinamibacterales bacterium]